MSDAIKHECGIVLLRLLKPLEYYASHYGTAFYGLNKLYLLMEKQHNRGQDGAGVGCIKFGVEPGIPYISRLRSNNPNPIKEIFDKIHTGFEHVRKNSPDRLADSNWLKQNSDFIGELYLGHLRYGTFGQNSIENVHPFLRQNNWMSKTLMIAGNFNLTNVGELFDSLVKIGQHPNATNDTITVLEKLGHFLDEENEELYQKYKAEGFSKKEISPLIADGLDLKNVLSNASKYWDGGYVIAGMIGHGDSFVMRDPAGIRPAFYYHNDDVLVVASERSAIRTALNAPREKVREVRPGHALIIKQNGSVSEVQIREPLERASCSFERIYFSRGTDSEIYQERKNLGRRLVPAILNSVNHDLENTLFSYIPNTAIAAFKGMVEGLNDFCDTVKKERIIAAGKSLNAQKLDEILAMRPRVDQVAVKDAKMRTFITPDSARDDLVAHVYDVTYGVVRRGKDNLVVIDDSIVRGTTLKKSIVKMLDRLGPKKIVVVSSAPQIRYPDCYGIDMARLGDLIAFRATLELLKETGQENIINEVYAHCKEQAGLPDDQIKNSVKAIYAPFSPVQISKKIAGILHPPKVKAELEIVFQTIEDLHTSCPQNTGDWYFTGNYPTPGGNRVANQSFINFIEGRTERAY
jgi:amidophosphoribosyltransferase